MGYLAPIQELIRFKPTLWQVWEGTIWVEELHLRTLFPSKVEVLRSKLLLRCPQWVAQVEAFLPASLLASFRYPFRSFRHSFRRPFRHFRQVPGEMRMNSFLHF